MKRDLMLLAIGAALFGAGMASATLFGDGLVATAHAEGATSWTCYVTDRLPDAASASDWKGAKKLTEGLNAVAPNPEAGEILATGWGNTGTTGSVPVLCVAH